MIDVYPGLEMVIQQKKCVITNIILRRIVSVNESYDQVDVKNWI